MPGVASLSDAFEKHAQRRAAGLPTPSVLIGDEVVEAWLGEQRERGAVRVAARAADEALGAYFDSALTRSRIRTTIESRVGSPRVSERTAYEEDLWRAHARDALLSAGARDAAMLLDASSAPAPAALAAAAHVLGDSAPSLLLDHEVGLDEALRVAVALAEAAPRACLAVATDARAWNEWLGTPGRQHAKALLGPCVVEVPRMSDTDRVRTAVEEARRTRAQATASRERADDETARSAAERALLEALDSAPASRDRFVLNRRLETLFGNRGLEIDLACPSLRLAVEVDGYFHFREPDAYRRDRRKDVLLQQEGYFVVRVLAEDVAERIDDVVATIHRVMRHLEKTR